MKQNNVLFTIVALSALLVPGYAQAAPSAGDMFANFTASAKALTMLVQYASYAIGIFLILNSIFKFSQLGSNPQMSPKVPITMFFVGVGIFALTSSLQVVQQTMAMGSGPGAQFMAAPSSGGAAMAAAINGVLYFIRLVGFIAFIRGWLLLNQAGNGKEGMIGRGLTHLGGGVAAINVDITARILFATFAPGTPPPF